MPKVLHVGPCDTPGGMATVMHTLAEYPPEGWEAELLASHAPGGLWAKWRAYRRARKELIRRCQSPQDRPDIVHVHTAADWSWRRKERLINQVPSGTGVVIHIHSGNFHHWLGDALSRRCSRFRKTVHESNAVVVVLSDAWERTFRTTIGPTFPISNPLHPHMVPSDEPRDQNHLLILGRPDPVKGHDIAIEVTRKLKEQNPFIHLTATGIEQSSEPFVDARGWVNEDEKLRLFQTASVLLLPSSFEGQPMVALEAAACGLPVVASEHLTSLPPSAFKAGPTIEHWVTKVKQVLVHPSPCEPLSAGEQLAGVQAQWQTCYQSAIQEIRTDSKS